MKIAFHEQALLLIFGSFLSAPATLSAEEPSVRIGVYRGMFRDITPETTTALMKPLTGILNRSIQLKVDAELFKDPEKLAKQLESKTVQVGVFHGYEFARQRLLHPKLEPLAVAVPCSVTLEACLVVNTASAVTTVADLDKATVLVPFGTKPHCVTYVESLQKTLVVKHTALTVEETLNEMAEGKIACAAVDLGSFNAYVRTRPGNGTVLRIIGKSKPFPLAVVAIYKDSVSHEVQEKIVTTLTTTHTTPHGKPLMMMWGLKSFQAMPVDYNDQLAAVLAAYPPKPLTVSSTK